MPGAATLADRALRGGAQRCGSTGRITTRPAQKDAATLYRCALRYRITGENAYADKAVELLNRWAATMKKPPTGNSNYALGAGIAGYEFACRLCLRGWPRASRGGWPWGMERPSCWMAPTTISRCRRERRTIRTSLEAPALKPRHWTHVAVTLSGDTGTLYVDGEAVKSASITRHPFFTQTQCYIGNSQFPDPLFKGRIADFRIYNSALPVGAIRDVFQRVK